MNDSTYTRSLVEINRGNKFTKFKGFVHSSGLLAYYIDIRYSHMAIVTYQNPNSPYHGYAVFECVSRDAARAFIDVCLEDSHRDEFLGFCEYDAPLKDGLVKWLDELCDEHIAMG